LCGRTFRKEIGAKDFSSRKSGRLLLVNKSYNIENAFKREGLSWTKGMLAFKIHIHQLTVPRVAKTSI